MSQVIIFLWCVSKQCLLSSMFSFCCFCVDCDPILMKMSSQWGIFHRSILVLRNSSRSTKGITINISVATTISATSRMVLKRIRTFCETCRTNFDAGPAMSRASYDCQKKRLKLYHPLKSQSTFMIKKLSLSPVFK